MTIIKEFIEALGEEIDTIKNGKGGSAVKLADGRFLRSQANFFLYSFVLENFITAIDDAPVEVQVGSGRHTGQIIQTQGLEVVIGVERDLGSEVSEARLILNSYYLHEMLRKKFEDVQAKGLHARFALADQVFAGQSHSRPLSAPLPPLEPGRMPNVSQQHAIDYSQSASLTYVWGPPGTGKTSTLSRIVESYVKQGLRVLVAVHANAAVDEVTEDIAETLKTTPFYHKGQILRLGNHQKASLTNEYDMVLVENVVQRIGAGLRDGQGQLAERRDQVHQNLAALSKAAKSVAEHAVWEAQYAELAAAVLAGNTRAAQTRIQLARQENLVTELQEKVQAAQAAGGLKRLLTGLRPEQVRQELERAKLDLDAGRRQFNEIQMRQREAEGKKADAHARFSAARWASDQALHLLGMSASELQERERELRAKADEISKRIEEIQKRLDDLPKRVLADARVVCTTLSKTFAAKELPDEPFDVLIVDEASMAPMPYLYWALGRCRRFAVVAGDFLQLPPICIANTPMARKWLGRSIYQQVSVTSVEEAKANPTVCLLDTQYRMHPDIAAVASGLFYGGLLRSHPLTSDQGMVHGLSGARLTLLDTSGAAPWCSRLSGGGRFNLYHAVLAAHAARKIVQDCGASVGIISPYAAQARLITKLLRDLGLEKRVRAATVHRFQGGEEDVIIFDSVEGVGTRVAPMLDDTQEGSEAKLLLNVALTRAKSQVVLLANLPYLAQQLPPQSSFARILALFREGGGLIECQGLVDSYFARSFRGAIDHTSGAGVVEPVEGALYTERNFYSAFKADLRQAQREVIVLSPFLSTRRSATLADLLRVLVERGVKVRVFTKPTTEQTGRMALNAGMVLEQLRAVGVEVAERSKMHQKVAIIDRAVAWEGSLNILSYLDTGEQMRRLPYAAAVSELIRALNLDDVSSARPQGAASAASVCAVEVCSSCGGELAVRVSEHGPFLCCTGRDCAWKKNIAPRSRVPVQTVCKICGSQMLVKSGGTGPFLGCSRYPECRQTMPLR